MAWPALASTAPSTEATLTANLGITDIRYTALGNMGGSDSHLVIQHAVMMVQAGANAVLVFRALNGYSGSRYGQPGPPQAPRRTQRQAAPQDGVLGHARAGRRGHAALHASPWNHQRRPRPLRRASSAYAAKNPTAWFFGRPITLEDHQSSRWIAPPVLRLLDCALGSRQRHRHDHHQHRAGAGSQAATRRHLDGRTLGDGRQAHQYHPGFGHPYDGESLARQLWEGAGLGPEDMDAAMFYDNFSPIVYITLEALGLCKPGEAKDFINSGGIGPMARCPSTPTAVISIRGITPTG